MMEIIAGKNPIICETERCVYTHQYNQNSKDRMHNFSKSYQIIIKTSRKKRI